jgi:hypothetical protein
MQEVDPNAVEKAKREFLAENDIMTIAEKGVAEDEV